MELNDSKGWHGETLDFLREFPELRAFTIIDLKIRWVEPIHQLPLLGSLDVITYCKTELRFSAFPYLQKCSLEWRPKAASLVACSTLNDLFVNRYSGKSVEAFGKLKKLEALAILNALVESLTGLRTLGRLRTLRLANL